MTRTLLLSSCLFISFFSITQNDTLLINNVQLFNGKDEKNITVNVLAVNNLIGKISTNPNTLNK